jgi:hypothetical protein
MSPVATLSDPNYWRIYVKLTDAALKSGQISPEELDLALKITAERHGINLQPKDGLYDLHDFDANGVLSFAKRGQFIKYLGGNPENKGLSQMNKNLHTVPNKRVVDLVDMFPGVKPGSVVGAAKVDLSQTSPIHGPSVGLPNMSYNWLIRGQHLGYFEEPVPFVDAFDDLIRDYPGLNKNQLLFRSRLPGTTLKARGNG